MDFNSVIYAVFCTKIHRNNVATGQKRRKVSSNVKNINEIWEWI